MSYRYVLANKEGDKSLWTGVFDSLESALKWFENWGEYHRSRGHELVLVETTSNEH